MTRRLVGWRVRWLDATEGKLGDGVLTWRKSMVRDLRTCEFDARDAAEFIAEADYVSHVRIMRVYRRGKR